MHSDDVDWTRLLNDRAYYDEFQATNNIPHHLQETIWKAIQSTQEPLNAKISPDSEVTVKQHIEESLTAPPTLKEFKSACKHTRGGNAPGMSDLT